MVLGGSSEDISEDPGPIAGEQVRAPPSAERARSRGHRSQLSEVTALPCATLVTARSRRWCWGGLRRISRRIRGRSLASRFLLFFFFMTLQLRVE